FTRRFAQRPGPPLTAGWRGGTGAPERFRASFTRLFAQRPGPPLTAGWRVHQVGDLLATHPQARSRAFSPSGLSLLLVDPFQSFEHFSGLVVFLLATDVIDHPIQIL